MTDRVLDTNILVYAYDRSDERKHAICRDLLVEAWKSGGATTIQNLSEFFVVVTRKVRRPMPSAEATGIIRSIVESGRWRLLDRDQFSLLKALELSTRLKTHFWDALIAQTMLDNGLYDIVTENVADFSVIPGIRVHNPLA